MDIVVVEVVYNVNYSSFITKYKTIGILRVILRNISKGFRIITGRKYRKTVCETE